MQADYLPAAFWGYFIWLKKSRLPKPKEVLGSNCYKGTTKHRNYIAVSPASIAPSDMGMKIRTN